MTPKFFTPKIKSSPGFFYELLQFLSLTKLYVTGEDMGSDLFPCLVSGVSYSKGVRTTPLQEGLSPLRYGGSTKNETGT